MILYGICFLVTLLRKVILSHTMKPLVFSLQASTFVCWVVLRSHVSPYMLRYSCNVLYNISPRLLALPQPRVYKHTNAIIVVLGAKVYPEMPPN